MRFEEALKCMREGKEVKYRNDVYYLDKKGRLRVRYSGVEMMLVPCFTAEKIMSEEWEINMLKNKKKINTSERNVKEDNTFCNQKRDENNTFCNLTELWKKGELKERHYYLKDNEYIFIDYFNGVSFEETCDFEIKEILAPVPSWEQWQQMKAFCEGFNTLGVSAENQRLKSLLKDLRKLIGNNFLNHKMRILLNEIDEVLNVPNE